MTKKAPQSSPSGINLRDGQLLVNHGIKAIVKLAGVKDSKVALAAATFLVEYGERLILEATARKPEPVKAFQQSRAELLKELEGLYRAALPKAPALVEAASEPADDPPASSNRF